MELKYAFIFDNAMSASSLESSLKHARSLVKQYCKSDAAIVEDFLKMRKNEAKLAEQKFAKVNDVLVDLVNIKSGAKI